MRCFFAFILLFISVSFCKAQSPDSINFTIYTRSNGLPEEKITSITQDSRGFIWLGSQEGLFHFDGLGFKSWYADANDSLKFRGNNVRVITGSNANSVLFLSNYELWQINIVNHKISPVKNLKGRMILSVERINNTEYCVISGDSLFVTNNDLEITWSCPLAPYFLSATVACFRLDISFMLLHSSTPNVFALFDHKNKKIIPVNIDNSKIDSRAKFLVPQAYDSILHRLYLSAYFNGNFYCDLDLPAVTNYIPLEVAGQPDGTLRKSCFLPGNKLLQGGENGLYLIDLGRNTTAQRKLLTNIILNIYEAKDGDLWLSTVEGVIRFNLKPPVINSLRTALNEDRDDEFKSILKANDGNIYVLEQTKSLYWLDITNTRMEKVENDLRYCWSAIKDNDEIIATGGGKKIIIYNSSTKKISYPDFLQPFYTRNTDIVTLAYKAMNGDKWYSCNGSVGLIRNPAGTTQYIQYSNTLSPPSFSHSYVHCAGEDSEGNIWFGANRTSMLLKWNTGKQRFEEYPVKGLLPAYKLNYGVNNIYIDPNDNLWLALDGAGLLRYNIKNRSGDYYDINKGLPTDAVFGICSDSKQRVWFATRKGLCCYLPARDKIVNFTTYDGLPEDKFEEYGIFYEKEKDLLYIGAKHSISFFNPDALLDKTLSAQPPVFIDEMLVNGKPVFFEDQKNISLKTKENNIEFNFAAPDLNRNNQLVFQYQLKGVSNDWIDLGDKRSVTFNNLQHGRYTLSVRTKYKGIETWSETAYPFSFSIKTPLQKTWWFRLLMGVVAGVLVWFIIRSYYKQKLERERSVLEKQQAIEKERTRIATDMHDDFGASLSRIKFLSEKMQLYKTGESSESTDLQKISLYSDQMSEKMNEIVWALNQRYDSLEDLVSFCRSYASEYLQDKNIKLNFTRTGITERQIQGETRRNIFLVIKEALHNVVKHAGATEVSISFNYDKDLQVTIADNGRGFTMDATHQFANGLENMKKRMTDINGSIIIENTNGTQISISAPV